MSQPGEEGSVTIVNDAFWLKRASDLIGGGAARLDRAAEALRTSLAWSWTVYVGSALVGSAIASPSATGAQIIAMAAPPLLLMLAYLAALWSLMPVPFEFDARAPGQVKSAYLNTIQTKGWRLRLAIVCTIVAMTSVAVAIGVAVATA